MKSVIALFLVSVVVLGIIHCHAEIMSPMKNRHLLSDNNNKGSEINTYRGGDNGGGGGGSGGGDDSSPDLNSHHFFGDSVEYKRPPRRSP